MFPLNKAVSTLLALMATASAYTTCVVPFGGPGVDDAATVRAMLPNCSTNAEIIFSSCTTYNISTAINFGTLQNVTVSILGNLNMPSSIPYVQSLVNVTGSLYFFTFKGNNVTLQGNTNPAEGFVYWHGEQWWKAAQYITPLGGLPLRPHGFSFNVNNTIIRNMKISKPIAWQFALSGSDYTIHDNWIDADYDLSLVDGFPFNTDGYDVKGPRFHFYNNRVSNGDDCVAVNNGAVSLDYLLPLTTPDTFLA
jgi:polygalacturonase